MSVTKFENAEGDLISVVDIDSENFSAKSSRCSCRDCDSLCCFQKRKKAGRDRCQCGICRDLKLSTLPNRDGREDRLAPDSATKKIIREVVTRETIESLKRVTETMYEFGTNENLGIITDKQSFSNKIECCKNASIDDSDIKSKKECCRPKPVVQVPSTDINQLHKDNNTATKLSAQVMNVPYDDLHESVPSSHAPTTYATEQNAFAKLNIFKRIKEIYDACSCKVCECISSKPRDYREDFCKCEPCQCQDCVKLKKNLEEKIRRIPHSGCPCIGCDRKDCRGITKNTLNTSEPQMCDCNPNDNMEYLGILGKRCKCEPCQCISCRLSSFHRSKTVKLGKVDKYIPRETCQCSPCECIECKQIYNRTNPTFMCTHSTDMSRYRNYCHCNNCHTESCQIGETTTCKCENHQNGTMRKSFDNNYYDYDIRTVMVDSNEPFKQQKECNFKKHNTVALFASLENSYPSNSCNRDVCKCSDCECIICSAKDNSLTNYKDHLKQNTMSLHNNIIPMSNMNACKCTPCECEICFKKNNHEDNIPFESKCRCDVCDCLNCDNILLASSSFPSSSFTPYNIKERQPAKPIKSINMNKNCDCNPCNCSNCKKLFSCSSSVKYYSNGKSVENKTNRKLRKVMLVTPSTSDSHFRPRKTYFGSQSSTMLSPKNSIDGVFGQDLSTCHAISHNYPPLCHLSNTNRDLYQDNKYNFISEDDIDKDMYFNLNNPVLDSASFKSIEEPTTLSYPCDFPQTSIINNKCINQNHYKTNDQKIKNFKIIHEQPDKITSNDSDELLPVFWPYCKETLHPKSFSRSVINRKTNYNPNDNLSDRLCKTVCLENKQDDFNPTFGYKRNSKEGDVFTEYVKRSYCDENYNYSSNDEGINLYQESQKNIGSFNPLVKNNNHRYIKSENIINQSDIIIDYERATRVLGEAKAFSSKLIKMLDSFETANSQFESTSQKFKILHESLLDINESELYKHPSLGRMPTPILESNFENISQGHHNDKESTDDSQKNENEAEREYEQSIIKHEDVGDFKYTERLTPANCTTLKIKDTDKIVEKTKYIDSEQDTLNAANVIDIIEKSNSKLEYKKAFNKVEILPSSKTPPLCVSHSNNFDQSQSICNNKPKSEIEKIDDVTNVTKAPTLATVMKKLDSVFGNIKTADTAVATNDVDKNPIELSKQEDKHPWQIFKKNLYFNVCPNDTRTNFRSTALELDIKEAIQAISLQSANSNYTKVVSKPNEALVNLRSEVNDLLNMPLLQNNTQLKYRTDPGVNLFPRHKLELEVKSMSSSASSQTYDQIIAKADKEVYFNINSETNKVSCEQLKATFIGLRRVSDHTVLVKWNVPKCITDVQGYELLVDGRAVQKIFSPTRSMAVVTCLPPAPRVLLTIRTIVSADCGHAPTTSVVYRPRMK